MTSPSGGLWRPLLAWPLGTPRLMLLLPLIPVSDSRCPTGYWSYPTTFLQHIASFGAARTQQLFDGLTPEQIQKFFSAQFRGKVVFIQSLLTGTLATRI